MNFDKFLPAKVKKFLNTGDDDAREKNDGKEEQHELTTVTSNKDQEHQAGPSSTAKDAREAGIIQLQKDNCENVSKALDFFKSHSIEKSLKDNEKVLVIKFEIIELFSELSSTELDEWSSRCNKNSIVIFLASKSDQKFAVYWKSKEVECFLTLKPYNSSLMKTSRTLNEFISKFLATSLNHNHLGIRNSSSMKRETTEFELHFLADHREYNVLLAAADIGDAAVVEILLKLGIETDSPFKDVNAQSLAYNGQHFHVLLLLFQSNLRYPVSMDISQCSVGVQNFVKMCNELHEHIRRKNRAEVNEIVTKNSNLRYFYNESNESAAATALRSNSLNIYEDLMMKEVYFGPHENTEAIMGELEPEVQKTVRELHFKHSKDLPESHINILMANSYVGHDVLNSKEKFSFVQHAFNVLNSYAFIRIILMVVAAARTFRIIFDFNRDTVHVADPTSGSYTNGIFYLSGRIYIGARQLLNRATELCHYVLNLTYNNDANSYKSNDNVRMQEFEKISEDCHQNHEKNEAVDLVYGCYPENMYHAELDVRAPHLTALYHGQPEKLQESKENFPELFKFMEENVGPEMEQALPDIESKVDKEIKEKDKKISKLRRNFYISIVLGIVIACLASWYFYKPTYMFNKLSVQDQKQVQNVFDKNTQINFKNVTVKLSDLFPSNSSIYEILNSNYITQDSNDETLNSDDPQLKYLEEQVSFVWESLTEKLKEMLLESELNFQDHNVKFSYLNESIYVAFCALNSKQIFSILSEEEFVIGKKLKSDDSFYLERDFIPEDAKMIDFEYQYGHEYIDNVNTRIKHTKIRTANIEFKNFYLSFLTKNFDNYFQIIDGVKKNDFFKIQSFTLDSENYHFMYRNSSQIIEETENERIFILSSEAGAGKTVTFERLAIEFKKKFPTRWVSYIDLKAHTEFYKTSGSPQNVEDLLSKIFRLGSEKNEFEVRIFEESYRSGTAVLVWNGFDEISPTFNEFILNLIKLIHNNSTNIQLVCTRPLYSDQLSKAFKIRTWQLLPFNEDKKHEFLRKFFISKNVSSEKIDVNINKVEKIIENLSSEKSSSAYKFETPLVLKVIAEIHENENLFNIDSIYRIYEAFVEKQIQIWLSNVKASQDTSKKLSLKSILQKYALLSDFDLFGYTTLGLKMRKLHIMQKNIPKNLPLEEISGMGILYINGKNEFEFAHKTFAEFFIAQYFIENIYEVDGDVNESEVELRLELFHHITKQSGLQIITDFMNSFLELNKDEHKYFHPTISKLLGTKFRNFLFRMLDTNYPAVFGFLFDFFKKDHDLLVELLHVHEDETLYTAIFNPNHFAINTNPNYVKELGQNILTDDEYEKFIHGRNQKGKILLGLQFNWLLGFTFKHEAHNTEFIALGDVNYWESIYKINENLTVDEQKELFVTAISPKIYMYYNKLFNTLDLSEYENFWADFENLLSANEMQEALGNALIEYYKIFPKNLPGHVLYLSVLVEKAENFLSSSQIYEMFFAKNILHEVHWDAPSCNILLDFFKNHTTTAQRRKILVQDKINDSNLFFYYHNGGKKSILSNYDYNFVYFDFTPFKIFHRALTIRDGSTFNLTKKIYHDTFNNTEIRELILSSNDFLYYVILRLFEDPCRNFISYLEELFKGYERDLKRFFKRKINFTNLSILDFIEDFRGLADFPEWFNNLEIFSSLYEKIKLV